MVKPAMPCEAERVVALVMAAGHSRRFGTADKRCARLPDGQSVLGATLCRTRQAFPLLRVAIRSDDSSSSLKLPADTPLIELNQAPLGLGASLAEAVAAIDQDSRLSRVSAVAILLGDMPYIAPATLAYLKRQAGPHTIVRPFAGDGAGHPVVFGRDFWPALKQLSGQPGARRVVQENIRYCQRVAVDDVGIYRDIDTPDDLARARDDRG